MMRRLVLSAPLILGCSAGSSAVPSADKGVGVEPAVHAVTGPATPEPEVATTGAADGAKPDAVAAAGGAATGLATPEDGDEEADEVTAESEGAEEGAASPEGGAALVRELESRLPDVEVACSRKKSIPCEASGDLDGDGLGDRVVRVKVRGGKAIGLAILWGKGGAELLGAGRKERWTVHVDDETQREAMPRSLDFLERWAIWPAYGPEGRRRGFRGQLMRRPHDFPAPKVIGDGILIDGGDSAAVAYYDGAAWRLIYLGF
ncbi:MAG: hypothetical protein H6711_20030 [Myxococcales bacterium]|nr:hypothetical protein [Myxococcales bacterium]MCB9704188.1 hypothetical protein [Myxococcales bacterium]